MQQQVCGLGMGGRRTHGPGSIHDVHEPPPGLAQRHRGLRRGRQRRHARQQHVGAAQPGVKQHGHVALGGEQPLLIGRHAGTHTVARAWLDLRLPVRQTQGIGRRACVIQALAREHRGRRAVAVPAQQRRLEDDRRGESDRLARDGRARDPRIGRRHARAADEPERREQRPGACPACAHQLSTTLDSRRR